MSESRGESGGRESGHERTRLPRYRYRELSDSALVDAMRAADGLAIDEFLIRYQRFLFDRARAAGLLRAESEECVAEVVEDVALLIMSGRIRPTRSLPAYVLKVFRNRMAVLGSELKRREGLGEISDKSAVEERGILSLCSEDALRASHGPEWEEAPITPALERLAAMLDDDLTDEERMILAWVSHYLPQRQIAAWLGVSYAAATQRIWRLRERLRDAAKAYVSGFDEGEIRELVRFFRRSSLDYDEGLRSGAVGDSPRSA